MTIREGRNEDWAVDLELCILAHLSFRHNVSVKQNCSHCSICPANLLLHSPLTREQNPEILELLTWVDDSFLTRSWHSTVPCWEPWPCWFSSQLHTLLLTDPMSAESHRLTMPSGFHHLQKALMRSHTTMTQDPAHESCDEGQPPLEQVWFTAKNLNTALTDLLQEQLHWT